MKSNIHRNCSNKFLIDHSWLSLFLYRLRGNHKKTEKSKYSRSNCKLVYDTFTIITRQSEEFYNLRHSAVYCVQLDKSVYSRAKFEFIKILSLYDDPLSRKNKSNLNNRVIFSYKPASLRVPNASHDFSSHQIFQQIRSNDIYNVGSVRR